MRNKVSAMNNEKGGREGMEVSCYKVLALPLKQQRVTAP
jgi:hypothetical protein